MSMKSEFGQFNLKKANITLNIPIRFGTTFYGVLIEVYLNALADLGSNIGGSYALLVLFPEKKTVTMKFYLRHLRISKLNTTPKTSGFGIR